MRAVCRAACVALAGSAIATASAQGPALRSPGIDVLDYDIHLELPDTGAAIVGDVTITVRRRRDAHALVLDLVPGMTVRTTTVNGAAARFTHTGAELTVPLDTGRGDSIQVRVRYAGVVRDGLIVRRDNEGRWTWFGDNWPDRARNWLPTVDHPSDKATVSFTVRAGSGTTVVANGELLGVEPLHGAEAGRSETRWREARPIATYLMVIGAGPLVRTDLAGGACTVSLTHRCVAQTVYSTPEHASFLPGPFAAAPAIVSYFEELVGPFPYEKLAHLQSATRFGGMENASAIFYAERLFAERSLRDGLIAHETAHQWFGDAVTEREWAHLWLSEGFATYFAALWTRQSRGEAAFANEMSAIRAQVLADPVVSRRPVIDTVERNYLALLNANSYQKGAYILSMLHEELGDSAFFGGLRAYYRTYRDSTAVSDDLRRALETASGRDLGPFFDQWLRRAGVPELTASWAYDASAESITLAVAQEGAALPYALRMPVEVRTADGQTSRYIVAVPALRRATVLLPARFSSAPQAVRSDPDSRVLGRVTQR